VRQWLKLHPTEREWGKNWFLLNQSVVTRLKQPLHLNSTSNQQPESDREWIDNKKIKFHWKLGSLQSDCEVEKYMHTRYLNSNLLCNLKSNLQKLQVVKVEMQANKTQFIIKVEWAYKCSSEARKRRRRRLIVTCYSIREYYPPKKVGFCFRTRRKKQKEGIVDPWEILELVPITKSQD